jgi:DNA-binding NarL/FixJ family response regulator
MVRTGPAAGAVSPFGFENGVMCPSGLIHLLILIADDHPVAQYGLRAAVAGVPDFVVTDAVASLTELLDRCRTHSPDVLLLDLRLGGAEPGRVVTLIRGECPHVRILMVSTDEAGDDLCRALDAGAAGTVSRDVAPEELQEAIRAVHAGSAWISADVAEQCQRYRAGVPLSEDELMCLRLLVDGKTDLEIAPVLQRPESYVRDCLRRIRQKLGARNQTEAVVNALRRGIVPLE